MSQRKARKEATRSRVIEAARALFEELGYLDTPVRAIAQRAGVSVGGVFTTFDGKAGILAHIVSEHRCQLVEEMLAAIPTLQGTVEDRLHRLITMAHAVDLPRLRTVTAYIGSSYSWNENLEQLYRDMYGKLTDALRKILSDGVAKGEIAKDTDLDVLLDMITGIHQRNYRSAWFNRLSAEELSKKTRYQLKLLLNGVRP